MNILASHLESLIHKMAAHRWIVFHRCHLLVYLSITDYVINLATLATLYSVSQKMCQHMKS